MKTLTIVATLIALALVSQVQATDPNATLTKATIRFDTPGGNDNKDHDTKVSVVLKSKINLFLSQDLAELLDFAGDTEFKDPSSHSFDLVLKSKTIKVADLGLPLTQIRITPNGNDRWIFGFTVTLAFSDGTTLSSSSKGNIILDQNQNVVEAVFTN